MNAMWHPAWRLHCTFDYLREMKFSCSCCRWTEAFDTVFQGLSGGTEPAAWEDREWQGYPLLEWLQGEIGLPRHERNGNWNGEQWRSEMTALFLAVIHLSVFTSHNNGICYSKIRTFLVPSITIWQVNFVWIYEPQTARKKEKEGRNYIFFMLFRK